MLTVGFPGTRETSSLPPELPVGGPGKYKPRFLRGGARAKESEHRTPRTVPPNEGNEVRRDGRRGVGASHSTVEAGGTTPGDPVEERGCQEHELSRGKMNGIPSPSSVSTKLRRIAEMARQAPQMAFTSLNHHIDIEFLQAAYHRTRKDGAVGIDGQTAQEYGANLEGNLCGLLERFKSGRYKAPPVRRVHIPKGDGGKTRPIGIPTFEDKVLQRAVTMVLESIYEQDFLDCSFGFRPGRSALQAIEYLRDHTMNMGGGWVRTPSSRQVPLTSWASPTTGEKAAEGSRF